MNRKQKRAQVSNFKKDSKGFGDFRLVVMQVDDLKKKMLAQHEMIQTLTAMVRSLDAKAMATVELCYKDDIFTKEEFEDATDREIGLLRRGPEELVQADDVVYVDFVAKDGDKVLTEDKNIAVKAGSGSIAFDAFLVGKRCRESGLVYSEVIADNHPSKDIAGKTITFEINILKAKGSADGFTDGRGNNGDTGYQRGDESVVVPNGSGHEGGHTSLGEYL